MHFGGKGWWGGGGGGGGKVYNIVVFIFPGDIRDVSL